MTLHPGSRSIAIGTLREAGFSPPEIRVLLERAEYQGRIERVTGATTYTVTFDKEAGYVVTRTPDEDQAPVLAADTFLARDVKRGWHMAGVGTINQISRADNDQLAFAGTQGERAFPRYALVEVTRPAPVMWNAEWPYPEFTAAEFAAHYQLAAEIIAARGYNAEEMRGYDGSPGVSICTALKLAARERAQAADPQGTADQQEITAANVTEELETRLSAVIYTLGLLHSRTGIQDFSDQLAAWELGHYTTGPNPARSDALGLLATAAGIFTHISDTQAEVTAPEVPGTPWPRGPLPQEGGAAQF
jgi:hypothetical protein